MAKVTKIFGYGEILVIFATDKINYDHEKNIYTDFAVTSATRYVAE